jgi:malonyl CoA-acyl carrier protein transacylase
MTGTAFVFPGQGSQKVGMGRAWAERFPEARAAYEEADDRLGFALSALCWQGPEEELRRTANTQPALLATSVAILRVLESAGARPAAAAGHSLGEYSALVAAGALAYGDALALVRRRGEGMAALLAAAEFRDPAYPVVVNADAAPVTTGAAARDALVRQIDSPVRWVESVERMAGELGIGTFVEVGPGKVLCALIRRIAPGSVQAGLEAPDALAELLERHWAAMDGG